jgi:pSer/pThr/pTyr-binding forkhead associated (FHA) protein
MSGPVVLVLRLLLTVSLYGFLGWAFLSLWRDIRLQSAILSARKVPPIFLRFTDNQQQPQVRRFSQAEVTIGRDPACECPIEDNAVSAHHARLSYHHNHWWLEDLVSTNGTLINQEKLTIPTVVVSDDEFRCGGTTFAISLSGDELPPPSMTKA